MYYRKITVFLCTDTAASRLLFVRVVQFLHPLKGREPAAPGAGFDPGRAPRRRPPEAQGGNGMIPRECKRLAEVDFPIAAVSRHAAREKSIRHGHPSTLHLWWARRPLASSRAVLLTLLLPDPCDPHCPPAFKAAARALLPQLPNCDPGADDAALRRALLRFVADFANWDLAAHSDYLRVSRALVKAAHGEEAPLVVDPFAGGGSIPLEALRLGCKAFASDLNPVACLILKAMLEDIPRHGPGLADELRKAGAEIRDAAARDLADLYPADPDGATPIAYLWARTARCEAPDCGAEIPLMRSFWLCRKPGRLRALRPRVERPEGGPPRVAFEIFEPQTESEVSRGTVTRARATCPCCKSVLPPERVRAQLSEQRGGADAIFDAGGNRIGGARMTAVVMIESGTTGRRYRLPTDADYGAVRKAQKRVADILDEWDHGGKQGLCPVPDEPLPPIGTLGFRVQRYGMRQWGDLFTARQKTVLINLSQNICKFNLGAPSKEKKEILGLAMSRFTDDSSSLTHWMQRGTPGPTFTLQALNISWDFCEIAPFDNASWSFEGSIEWLAKCAENLAIGDAGQVGQSSATEHPLPDEAAGVLFTDPPYYDAIPYADLSDFFLVWLKRALPDHPLLHDPFDPDNLLSPKSREAVQDETKTCDGHVKDRAFFEDVMEDAFAEGRRVLRGDGIASVVFAHKTTEGWEALLSGMIRGGWTIAASWPITTERPGRLRSRDSAALATSIHLICRPRPEDAPVGDWADVLRELPERVADWMERLQGEGVRGADLVFACIGPALEIFSRRRAVETADGRRIGLPEYLEKVWETVGRAALRRVLGAAEARARNGLAGALEEDARLTALFLWTLQSTETSEANGEDEEEKENTVARATAGGFHLPFDVVRRFSQPMGIDLDRWTGGLVALEKGVVRLLPVAERARPLFGEDGAGAIAERVESDANAGPQATLFENTPKPARRRRETGTAQDAAEHLSPEATVLDRVHAAMLFQANGHAGALRALIVSEQDRGPDFLRLSNALSALYPRGSREKRLLDAMLLAAPR